MATDTWAGDFRLCLVGDIKLERFSQEMENARVQLHGEGEATLCTLESSRTHALIQCPSPRTETRRLLPGCAGNNVFFPYDFGATLGLFARAESFGTERDTI